MDTLDSNIATPRKGPRSKNQTRYQADGSNGLATPTKTSTISEDLRRGHHSDPNGSGNQTPVRQARRTPNTTKAKRQPTASIPIASVDGAGYPSISPQKATCHSNNVNYNKNVTPAKQAYAGPTFHASPAPSSLPIPKFFSKPVGPGTTQATSHAQLGTSPLEQGMPPLPGFAEDHLGPPPQIRREESPLDLFFNAHRAEQARHKASDIPQGLSSKHHSPNGTSSNELGQRTDLHSGRGEYQHQVHKGQQLSGKEMFMMELDGTDDQHGVEPGTSSTPFCERMNAVQHFSRPSSNPTRATLDEQDRLAKTLALKQLLKGMPSIPGQAATHVSQYEHSQPYADSFRTHRIDPSRMSPSLPHQLVPTNPFANEGHPVRSTVSSGPQDPILGSHTRNTAQSVPDLEPGQSPMRVADVKTMEADLRRLLKLDP